MASSEKWFRVYSADRKARKVVGACSLDKFIAEAKNKFDMNPKAKVTIVLEEDGTIVDEDGYFLHGLSQNDALMILHSDELWTAEQFPDSDEVDNAASTDNVDGSGSTTGDSYLQLRQLTSKLRADLQQLLLFTPADYQMIVDADKALLARLLHRSIREVERIQSSCQRYLDDHEDFVDARNVLHLLRNEAFNVDTSQAVTLDDDDNVDGVTPAKRSRAE